MQLPDLKTFPDRPGVYFFKDDKGKVLYVGKALSLKNRLSSYFQKNVFPKTQLLIKESSTVNYIETGSELEALLLESNSIKKYLPHYNIALKDDKSYIYIFISVDEDFPKVWSCRRPKDLKSIREKEELYGQKGVYLGPYPSTYIIKNLLKQLRKIFPYCQQKSDKRKCFYSHIGLCDPCPAQILKNDLKSADYLAQKYKYRRNVLLLKRVLEGNLVRVEKLLTRRMKQFARSEEFEEATGIRNQLVYLQMMTRQRRVSFFLQNPNYYFEAQKKALDELRDILSPFFPSLDSIERIECYDISHFQGSFAVGSMVVFNGGVPEKSLYRRFKIRVRPGSDVESLSEIIKRRFLHPEWEFPQLLLIDGGKPQVSKIIAVCQSIHITIPIIGLAKRWEELHILHNEQFVVKQIARKSDALKLLQQMRDEAHRFALTFHRLLRRKQFTSSNK